MNHYVKTTVCPVPLATCPQFTANGCPLLFPQGRELPPQPHPKAVLHVAGTFFDLRAAGLPIPGGGVGGGWGFCVGQGSPSCCEWVGNPALPVPPGASSAGLSRGCRCLTLPELIRTHTCHLSPSRDPMSPRLPPASVPVGCGVGAPTTASPDGENSKPGSDCWGHTAGWRQGCTEPRAGVPKTLALSASHAQRGRLRSPG